ncbi:MAG: tail fiber domain-containing protein [Elusimicrobia bacterium]|nr:tail fiber domain-containing protein [Elusimicrobiota bacterium]
MHIFSSEGDTNPQFLVSVGTVRPLEMTGSSLTVRGLGTVSLPGGYLGVGTAYPNSRLEIKNGALAVSGAGAGLSINGSPVLTSNTTLLETTSSNQTKDGSLSVVGSVGIGTTSAGAKLDVGGGLLSVSDYGVGIGTLNTFMGLEVYGTARTRNATYLATGDDMYVDVRYGFGVDKLGVSSPEGTNDPLLLVSEGVNKLFEVTGSSVTFGATGKTVVLGGNVGVGTNNASSRFDLVNGSLTVRGTGADVTVGGASLLTSALGLENLGSTQTKAGGLILDGLMGVGKESFPYIRNGDAEVLRIYTGGMLLDNANWFSARNSTDDANVNIMRVNSDNQIEIGEKNGNNEGIFLRTGYGDSVGGTKLMINKSGNVGIGTVDPKALLQVGNPGNFTAAPAMSVGDSNGDILSLSGSSNKSNLNFYFNDWHTRAAGIGVNPYGTYGTKMSFSLLTGAETTTEKLVITSRGDVGFGTSNPAARFHLVDDVFEVGLSQYTMQLAFRNSGTVNHTITTPADYSGAVFNYEPAPESCTLKFGNNSGSYFRMNRNKVVVGDKNAYNDSADFSVDSSKFVVRGGNDVLSSCYGGIVPIAYVGLGVASPGYNLQLSLNSAAKPGGGSWTVSSDARLKKNIKQLEGSLGKLLSLRGVTYEWKEPEKHGNLTGTRLGMIAQDVEKVFPEWVGTDSAGYKSLTVSGFEALTVESFRELNQENDRLEERNRKLQERLRLLKEAVKQKL